VFTEALVSIKLSHADKDYCMTFVVITFSVATSAGPKTHSKPIFTLKIHYHTTYRKSIIA